MQIEDQETAQTNSEAETQTSGESHQSGISTTEGGNKDDSIDLGEGDAGQTGEEKAAAEKAAKEAADTRTPEQREADEKAEAEQREADEKAEAERAEMFGAPEDDKPYEIEGLPEGMEVDKDALEALTPIARRLDLSNKGMSAFAQVYAEKILPGVSQKLVDGINADVVAKRTAWETEAREAIAGKGEPLKTAGGEPINFGGRSMGEVQKIAAKALDKYAPEGFRKWLDETGLGVHPQMIGLAFNVGKDTAEDRDAEPSETNTGRKTGGNGRPMTDASKFYSHS